MKERKREMKERRKKVGKGRKEGEKEEGSRNLGMLIWQKMWGRRGWQYPLISSCVTNDPQI